MVAAGRWRATQPRDPSGTPASGSTRWSRRSPNAAVGASSPPSSSPRRTTRPPFKAFVTTILGEPWRELGGRGRRGRARGQGRASTSKTSPPRCSRSPPGATCRMIRRDHHRGMVAERGVDPRPRGGVGQPARADEFWADVDHLLRSRWPHPNGGTLRVDAAAIDAGDGGHYDAVLRFCQPRLSRRVLAGQGRVRLRAPGGPARQGQGPGCCSSWGWTRSRHNCSGGWRAAAGWVLPHAVETRYYEGAGHRAPHRAHGRGRPVARFERKPGTRAEYASTPPSTPWPPAPRAPSTSTCASRSCDRRRRRRGRRPRINRRGWSAERTGLNGAFRAPTANRVVKSFRSLS